MKFNGSTLKFAIQKKGRLLNSSLDLLRRIGLDFEISENKLSSRVRNFDIDLIFLRDDDIPEYVEDGVCDLGIVGQNIIEERQADIGIIEKLGFGRCQLAIAIPKSSSIKKLQDLNGKRLATSYPRLLEQFLNKQKVKATMVELHGSVELAPALQVAEGICDLVSTGATLKLNGLKILQTIFDSQAVLIKKYGFLSPAKKLIINQLLLRIKASLFGQNNKYLLMNASRKILPQLLQFIPALKSPTITPLAAPDMIAIHSVVPAKQVWEVMAKVKNCGASGILVLPIENMMP